MKNILLVCAGGMSTSILVGKMKDAAKELNIKVDIEAIGVFNSFQKYDGFDVILLGPQIRFQRNEIENIVNGKIPVEVIETKTYSRMNGKAILEQAMSAC